MDGPTINEAANGGDVALPTGLTIHEAAETTGWSARMLRYVERSGLIAPSRTASGYRLYGPAELQRLRTLKELLARFELGLSDVAFAARMDTDPELRAAVQAWLQAQPRRPEHVEASDWLRFEQSKHERLLAGDFAAVGNSLARIPAPA
jgi:MerR family copper efflux transcriptional regulator